MKIRLKYLIGMSLAIATLVVLPVTAESTTSSSGASSSSSASSSSDKSTQTTIPTLRPESAAEKQANDAVNNTTLAQRVAQHEAETKVKLTTADQTHLKARCQPAQTTIKTLGDKVNANVPQRVQAYQDLTDKLTAIAAKLKAQGLDTAELTAENAILVTKIATFKADLILYKQALADLNAINCVNDPTAFKAALEAAKTLRDKLTTDATDISTYVTKTIKPTLATLRSQLEAKVSTGGSH